MKNQLLNYDDSMFKKKTNPQNISTNKNVFINEAFSRNYGLISPFETAVLANKRVAIPGMGGVGGYHLINLIRLGVGQFNIADFDTFDIENSNRQYGAKTSNYKKNKAEVMAQEAYDINPFVKINITKEGINDSNIDEFLEDVDLVVDGLDFFVFETRRMLFKKAREKGIYVVTAGPIGFSSAMLIFSPNSGLTFDEYFNISDDLSEQDRYLHFLLGLTPKITHRKYSDFRYIRLKDKKGPSSIIGCNIATSSACTESLKILLNRSGIQPVPHYFQYDLYSKKFHMGKLRRGLKNPKMKILKFIIKKQIDNYSNYLRPKDLKIPSVISFDKNIIPKETLHFIIEAGILAPSGDNCQPYKFIIIKNSIAIYLNANVDKSIYNFDQRASYIACGALIKNMQIAASVKSLNTEIKYIDQENYKNQDIRHIAIINFKELDNTEASPLYPFLQVRHTNRTSFKKINIKYEHMKDFIASSNDLVQVVLKDGKNDIKGTAEILSGLDLVRAKNKNLHEHLMSYVRFTTKDANKSKTGFHVHNLNLDYFQTLFFRLTKPWKIAKFFYKYLSFDKLTAAVAKKSALESSAFILLKGKSNKIDDYINVGNVLEEVWLKATSCGYDIQPMCIAPIFFSILKINPQLFSKKELNQIKKHEQLFNRIYEVNQNKIPYVLLRVGKGSAPKQGTTRMDITAFIQE